MFAEVQHGCPDECRNTGLPAFAGLDLWVSPTPNALCVFPEKEIRKNTTFAPFNQSVKTGLSD
jgi:hypothetical protein